MASTIQIDESVLKEADQCFVDFQAKILEDLGVQFQLQIAYTNKGIFPAAIWVPKPKKSDEKNSK